jgi:hypothetical protein
MPIDPVVAQFQYTITIPASGTISDTISLVNQTLVGIQMPAAWSAADLTFRVSPDNINFSDMYDQFGNEFVVKTSASRFVVLNPADWVGVRFLSVRSGTVGTPVTQPSARDITFINRAVQ